MTRRALPLLTLPLALCLPGCPAGSGDAAAAPPEKKTEYMAVFYTFTQIMMALSPFVAGWMLLASQNVAGSVSGIVVDQYALYFASSLFLMLLGLWVFIVVRDSRKDQSFGKGEAVGTARNS